MKLFAMLPVRQHAAPRLASLRGPFRRWMGNNSSAAPSGGGAEKSAASAAEQAAVANKPTMATTSSNQVSSVRAPTAGTVRIRRGNDPNANEMEMDTTITRMMGSDWGDRSKQPVTYAMKLYWGIFILVLANGAFTYFAGKDESFIVEQVQKKVDEKLGRVETNEFVIMADTPKPAATPTSPLKNDAITATKSSIADKPGASEASSTSATASPPASMFASKVAPTPLPFFTTPTGQRQSSKADYERQLQQLRNRQARAKEELKDTSSFRSIDEIELEIKRIDQQKAHIKQLLKKL